MNIHYPPSLPVSQQVEKIKKTIADNQITILCGETGSGKTTQLPKICLSMGRGKDKFIGHTQPRRIAARSVATRIASELEVNLGEQVGFKVRFADKTSKGTSIKVMTDGILLAETQKDPKLLQYDTLIIDEAHERSLNIDFLLGYIKNLLPKRPDLKIIITSATIDVDKFSEHFNQAPIIQVSGRTFPVDIVYRPLRQISKEVVENIEDAILSSINDLPGASKGDILIFLPGERDIHDIKKFLSDQLKNRFEILPLFSRLPVKEQQKIFKQGTSRRIILTTNIAETSLTVPGIKYVIDVGLARIIRYNPRLKIEQLLIEKISQASANQRSGRCGRISPGVCIRLYDEEDFDLRPAFTDPEIMRTSLASVILKMASLHLGPVHEFPFLQPPINKFIQDGYQLLYELDAVDRDFKILPMGHELAKLPLDPSLGRILIESNKQACLNEILIIISALSISDPRERPLDKSEKADQAHLLFHDPESGFMSFIKLWKLLDEKITIKSGKGLRNFCQQYFVSYTRIREWQELYKQLYEMTKELGFKVSKKEVTYEQIHLSLLSGLLGNIGTKVIDSYEYAGTRGIKFLIGPTLFRKKNYKWIMAAEIIDTGKLYAQCIAKIEVDWVERLSKHLVDYEYYSPRWNPKLNRVDATQKTLLYGLVINANKTVHYGAINLEESRSIFIRQGLVENQYESSAPFWAHNQKLIDEVKQLEHKSRRQDILINDDILFDFYDSKISQEIMNGAGFEFWRKGVEKDAPQFLYLTKEYLMQKNADQIDDVQFPDQINRNNINVNLNYHFEPNHPMDGLTATFPYHGLSQIKQESFDWLVPGMIREKVLNIFKLLPKPIRTQLTPLPKTITEFLVEADTKNNFNEELTNFIRKKTNSSFRVESSLVKKIPMHLKVNFTITDDEGVEIDTSKELAELQTAHKEKVTEVIEEVAFDIERNGLVFWPELDIPETVSAKRQDEIIVGYPALTPNESDVDLKVLDNESEAITLHKLGVRKLLTLQLKERIKVLKKTPPQFEQYGLALKTYIAADALKENFMEIVLNESMNWDQPIPRTKKAFEALAAYAKKRIGEVIIELSKSLTLIAENYHAISLALKKQNNLTSIFKEDIEEQLELLLPAYEPPLFVYDQLKNFPRYLTALKLRIEKFHQRQEKDTEALKGIRRLQDKWIEKVIHFVENDEAVPDMYVDFQYALQELRVSLFAQELKTLYPISLKRVEKQWHEMMLK